MALSLAMAALIGSIVAGIGAAGSNVYSAIAQKQAQEQANKTNIELANEQNAAQLQQVRETNEFNAAQAQIDRDRQDTTMQRAMADYSAAGLNPLLAVGSSTGAYSTPVAASGNVAQIQRAKVDPAALDFSGMASAFSSMSNAMLVSAMMRNNNLDRIMSHEKIAELNRLSRESIASANRVKHVTYQNGRGVVTAIKRNNYDW